MTERSCPECDGDVIGPIGLDTVTGGSSGELNLTVTQTSGMVRRPTHTPVRALVCTECGRVELRADPREIAERWRAGER